MNFNFLRDVTEKEIEINVSYKKWLVIDKCFLVFFNSSLKICFLLLKFRLIYLCKSYTVQSIIFVVGGGSAMVITKNLNPPCMGEIKLQYTYILINTK